MLAGVDESGRSYVPAAKSGTNMTLLAVPPRDAGPYPLTGPTFRANRYPPEDIAPCRPPVRRRDSGCRIFRYRHPL